MVFKVLLVWSSSAAFANGTAGPVAATAAAAIMPLLMKSRLSILNSLYFQYGEISRRRAMIGGSFSNVN